MFLFFFYSFPEDETNFGSKAVDNITAIKALLNRSIRQSDILSVLPSGKSVCQNRVIYVDLSAIKNDWQDDHRWKCTSAPKPKKYKVKYNNNGDMEVDPTDAINSYSVKRHRYIHHSAPDFHRLIVTINEPDGNTFPLAPVQYRFDNEPHMVHNNPHGNSKENVPFIPTKKGTITKLTEELQRQKSVKRAIFKVERSENCMKS